MPDTPFRYSDREFALISTAMFTGMGMFFAGFIGFMATQLSMELGVAVGAVGMSGALAVARSYWAASTRTVRARIDRVMDAVGKVLDG